MTTTTVIHARDGRVRLRVPNLIDNPALARQLTSQLIARSTVCSVYASTITGSLLIHYDRDCSLNDIIAATETAQRPLVAQGEAWWRHNVDTTWRLLDTSAAGLTAHEATVRLSRYGANVQRLPQQHNDWALLAQQFVSLPVLLLCASATMSVVTGGLLDAVLIGGVVAANAGIGFFSERSATRVIEALIRQDHNLVTVRRDGDLVQVATASLVPGDLLLLTPGTIVPADARVVEADGLTTDESLLTGESAPVLKYSGPIEADRPLAERQNMAFCGTTITAGKGIATVVATGFATEIGRITLATANMERQPTPMQRQIDRLGLQLTSASVVCAAAVAGFGWLHQLPGFDVIRRSIALAVAAIPEGLPMVATSVLATGLQAARRRDVLIRSLSAVETLGSVTVMCFDKTGTLTRNQMDVVKIVADGDESRADLLRVTALCNESELGTGNGSSTENALVVAAVDAGINVADLRARFPLLRMNRRNETQRYMISVHDVHDNMQFIAIKGDPMEVLTLCERRHSDTGLYLLDYEGNAQIGADNMAMTDDGLRVLGVAYAYMREGEAVQPIWLGMVGMSDQPRPEVPAVMAQFHAAGIRTVMVTGDQIGTASAIARQVALADHIEAVDCTSLDVDQLPARVASTDVFARVSPLHKLAVVRAMQGNGDVVAMTGDGTNDGPALRAADIGVTFGLNGTDAARTIADIVLARDDIEGMVVAVQQGRTIYENIRKALHFLVGTNSGEVMLTVASTALGTGQPLNTLQLLWINLVTDVAIAFALGFEQSEGDVMQAPPRPPSSAIISGDDYRRLLKKGAMFSTSAFAAHLYGMQRYGAGGGGLGMLTLLGSQLLDGFSSRSATTPVWRLPPNRPLRHTVLGLMALQAVVGVVPWTRRLLGIAPLGLADLAVILGGAIWPFLAVETLKDFPSITSVMSEKQPATIEKVDDCERA